MLDGPNEVPTGRNATARHPGGAVFEYVEFAKDRALFPESTTPSGRGGLCPGQRGGSGNPSDWEMNVRMGEGPV